MHVGGGAENVSVVCVGCEGEWVNGRCVEVCHTKLLK